MTQRHLYPNSTLLLEIKTKFQQQVTETKRNIAETSQLHWPDGKSSIGVIGLFAI